MHLGVYEHHMSNGTCRVLLDKTDQYVINKVMKTSIAKNSTIVKNVFLWQQTNFFLLMGFSNLHQIVKYNI
jgi:hypothetical protein